MGRSFYDVASAALPNGGGYVTAESMRSLANVRTAALTLETAVSSSLFAAVTGIMGAPAVVALSASYASVTTTIA